MDKRSLFMPACASEQQQHEKRVKKGRFSVTNWESCVCCVQKKNPPGIMEGKENKWLQGSKTLTHSHSWLPAHSEDSRATCWTAHGHNSCTAAWPKHTHERRSPVFLSKLLTHTRPLLYFSNQLNTYTPRSPHLQEGGLHSLLQHAHAAACSHFGHKWRGGHFS